MLLLDLHIEDPEIDGLLLLVNCTPFVRQYDNWC